jgi:hypothetical protein
MLGLAVVPEVLVHGRELLPQGMGQALIEGVVRRHAMCDDGQVVGEQVAADESEGARR